MMVICPKSADCKIKSTKDEPDFCLCSEPHEYDPQWCKGDEISPECPACVETGEEKIK